MTDVLHKSFNKVYVLKPCRHSNEHYVFLVEDDLSWRTTRREMTVYLPLVIGIWDRLREGI